MHLVDTHTHLYAKEFDTDRSELIKQALDSNVKAFLLPNIDSEWIAPMLSLTEQFPKNCFAMMGLHPCSVKENYKTELRTAEQWLNKKKFYGIGEIGIDHYWDMQFINEQDDAFSIQCHWANEMQLPVSIHSRNATTHAITLIEKMKLKNLTGVFHCFGGTMEDAKHIFGLGLYIGIGGVVTFKNGGMDKLLPEIDLKHIVLETDAPYLSPAPHRGKRNLPEYLILIAQRIAEIKQTTLEEVIHKTTANAQHIFKL